MNEIIRGKTIVSSVKKSLAKARIYGELNLQNIYLLKWIGRFLDRTCNLSFDDRQRLETLYNYIKYNDKDICNLRQRDLVSFKHLPFCKNCNANNIAVINNNLIPSVDDNSVIAEDDYTFNINDFTKNFIDPFGGTFKTVRITSLPSIGNLIYDGTNVTTDFEFNIVNVNKLSHQLGGQTVMLQSDFTFQTSNNNINTLFSNMATFTLNINAQVNLPPTSVGDGSVTMANAATHVFTVANFTTSTVPVYSDPEGDAAENLRVLSLPVDGELQYNGIAVTLNQIIPFQGAISIASGDFRYVASSMNSSADTEVFDFEISDTGSNTFVG